MKRFCNIFRVVFHSVNKNSLSGKLWQMKNYKFLTLFSFKMSFEKFL